MKDIFDNQKKILNLHQNGTRNNLKIMLIISSREFREKQSSYFNQADEGVEILVQRGKNKSYKIVPVTDDDTLMSKKAFFEMLDHSIQDIKNGKGTRLKGKEELKKFFDSL